MAENYFGTSAERMAGATVFLLLGFGVVQVILGKLVLESVALTANGIDCIGDGFVSVVVLIGLNLFRRPADNTFHYGYYKIENLASIAAAFLMFTLAAYIGYRAYLQFNDPQEIQLPILGIAIALAAAISAWSIGAYKYFNGRRTGLGSLRLDAINTIKDGSTSFLTVIALAISASGYPIADAIVGFIIATVIASIGFASVKEAGLMLVDACDGECLIKGKDIQNLARSMEGVLDAEVIRLRRTGPFLQGELEIIVDASTTIHEADKLRMNIQAAGQQRFPDLKHLTVIAVPRKVNGSEEDQKQQPE